MLIKNVGKNKHILGTVIAKWPLFIDHH